MKGYYVEAQGRPNNNNNKRLYFSGITCVGSSLHYKIIILLIIPFVPQAPSVGNPIIIPPK